jgi:Concanavalin A-like lectin/glucanases superfamily
MKLKPILLAASLMGIIIPPSAMAQEPQFAPVMAEFDGKGALLLPPMPALDINGAGTIELWMAAKWAQDPGYDPALLAYVGPSGPRFALVVTADRQALGVYAGKNYAVVPFDFSDGAQHFVALTTLGDTIYVMIDGEVQGALDFGFADLPANSFSIGAMGKFSPFIGDIGQVRIWDEPIDIDTLTAFSWREMTADGPSAHPDLDALVGVSAFANPETGGFIFVGNPDDPAAALSRDTSIDDSDIIADNPN